MSPSFWIWIPAPSMLAGRRNLVLLDANPLDDIGNSRRIHGVMVRGTWHSSGDIERRMSRYRESGNP